MEDKSRIRTEEKKAEFFDCHLFERFFKYNQHIAISIDTLINEHSSQSESEAKT
ncbi:hypothetical protein XCR1_1430047 [Xenorhabdus cabanillasii JM26]|uniref:Uncharacterized protein n=1 Tax=Xenorhabdus cabanillasii JM26 TaxID=1427517 RepID=W1ISS8_9GAMM|nr:hypothetical protein XCR1_1430047 [Xenorhabdus cabanillasii JM26]